jgi:hypothetical protein
VRRITDTVPSQGDIVVCVPRPVVPFWLPFSDTLCVLTKTSSLVLQVNVLEAVSTCAWHKAHLFTDLAKDNRELHLLAMITPNEMVCVCVCVCNRSWGHCREKSATGPAHLGPMMAPDNACERAGLSWNLTTLAGVWALRSCQVRMDVEVLALFVPFRIFQNAFQMRYLAIQSSATRTYGFMRSLGILGGLLEWIR